MKTELRAGTAVSIAISLLAVTAVAIGLTACSTTPAKTAAGAATTRRPADEDDGAALPPPPFTKTMDAWVYTWTHNPAALTDGRQYVASSLERARDCVGKIAMSEATVTGCEGDEMAAGPGLYTCDNPFTSHDYGSTLVAVRLIGGKESIGLVTGRYTPPPASDGLDRSIYADAKYEGLLYNFRTNDMGGRALVLRNSDVVDVASVEATDVRAGSYVPLAQHAAFTCTPTTPVRDVMVHWGDHLEFLSLVFNFFTDPEGTKFLKNGALDRAGVAAAIASDALARPDADLQKKLKLLKQKFPVIQSSLSDSDCRESESISLRSCVAKRIFSGLLGDVGTPNNPTGAWPAPVLRGALVELGVTTPAAVAGLKTSAQLLTKLSQDFQARPNAGARALEAYRCMEAVRSQGQTTNFGLWGDDPQ